MMHRKCIIDRRRPLPSPSPPTPRVLSVVVFAGIRDCTVNEKNEKNGPRQHQYVKHLQTRAGIFKPTIGARNE